MLLTKNKEILKKWVEREVTLELGNSVVLLFKTDLVSYDFVSWMNTLFRMELFRMKDFSYGDGYEDEKNYPFYCYHSRSKQITFLLFDQSGDKKLCPCVEGYDKMLVLLGDNASNEAMEMYEKCQEASPIKEGCQDHKKKVCSELWKKIEQVDYLDFINDSAEEQLSLFETGETSEDMPDMMVVKSVQKSRKSTIQKSRRKAKQEESELRYGSIAKTDDSKRTFSLYENDAPPVIYPTISAVLKQQLSQKKQREKAGISSGVAMMLAKIEEDYFSGKCQDENGKNVT